MTPVEEALQKMLSDMAESSWDYLPVFAADHPWADEVGTLIREATEELSILLPTLMFDLDLDRIQAVWHGKQEFIAYFYSQLQFDYATVSFSSEHFDPLIERELDISLFQETLKAFVD